MRRLGVTAASLWLATAAAACGGEAPVPTFDVVAVTFNTGTNPEMDHDAPPDDGYGSVQAGYSDLHYGDGLAWVAVIENARAFFAGVRPDVVAFQEIFHSGGCPDVPVEARPGFVCETWADGDPTVAQLLVGDGYQVVCHPGHADKCLAVRRAFGAFRGCAEDFCVEGAAGFPVAGCGSGARVARAVIDLAAGGELTVVNFHGTSGLSDEDKACRVGQVDQVFVDLGDGAPAASGARNLVLGDLNTDPGRLAGADPSAARWLDFADLDGAAGALPFHFVSDAGPDAPRSYADTLTIDHVLSDAGDGPCWIAGLTDGHPAVTDAVYFDHKPVVCTVAFPQSQ